MTSPYFVESTAVITRSGNKTVPRAGLATTLKTRMERRVLRAHVKQEEEVSSVSNQSLGRDASDGTSCSLKQQLRDDDSLQRKRAYGLAICTQSEYTPNIFDTDIGSSRFRRSSIGQSQAEPDKALSLLPLAPILRRRQGQVKVEYDGKEEPKHWEPPDWSKQLGHVRQMRSARDAPVDLMGAEKCYDTHAPDEVGETPLVSVSLSYTPHYRTSPPLLSPPLTSPPSFLSLLSPPLTSPPSFLSPPLTSPPTPWPLSPLPLCPLPHPLRVRGGPAPATPCSVPSTHSSPGIMNLLLTYQETASCLGSSLSRALTFPEYALTFPEFALAFPEFALTFPEFALAFPEFALAFPEFALAFPNSPSPSSPSPSPSSPSPSSASQRL
ncbi:unnamed protein product [Oncorhynchus mykiss]|uniref:Uncharacterized protein n=1 Tax=Oncorhynchus mykiss TaxID=8022 RepID=A0A060Z8G6_ONCMY|nr:unnamed protein product [Oncorhynchus mykiss]